MGDLRDHPWDVNLVGTDRPVELDALTEARKLSDMIVKNAYVATGENYYTCGLCGSIAETSHEIVHKEVCPIDIQRNRVKELNQIERIKWSKRRDDTANHS